MDELDIKIIRELSQARPDGFAWGEVNPSLREIGKKLGVSRETVRDRVEKMSESGFMKIFPVQVNPSLLGMQVGALSLDAPQSIPRGELVEELSLLDGMILVVTHVGGMIGVSFFYEDETALEKKIRLISRMCRASNALFTGVPVPPCGVSLSARDWQIVAALQRGPVRPARKVAAELGISVKTLKRRTKRMIEGMAISTMVSSAEGKLKGGVIANLQVEYSSPRTRSETDAALMSELDSRLIYSGLWSKFSLFTLVLPNVPAASQVLERVKRTPGVSHARIDLIEERTEVYTILRELVDRKLRNSGGQGRR